MNAIYFFIIRYFISKFVVILIQYLDEIKAIKHWNLDGKPLTPFELNYLRFYNTLAPCYAMLRDELLKNNEGYLGLAFNVLLHDMDINKFSNWDKVVFAGFNAFTAAEEKLVKTLLESEKAEIYWDADDFYLTDPRQEAGSFLRKHIAKNTFGPLNWISDTIINTEKEISVFGVPGNVGQAKLSGTLIKDIIKRKGTSEGIALVLVDESLLLPVLNSIPNETGDFNVTMGFPLKQTPVFSLINIVLTLFANGKRFAQKVADDQSGNHFLLRFYYKDIQRFLSHPFIFSNQNNVTAFSENQESSVVDKSFYTAEELLHLLDCTNNSLSSVFRTAFDKKKLSPGDVIILIRDIISYLSNALSLSEGKVKKDKNSNNAVGLEYLYHASLLCSKLDVILNDPALNPDLETIQLLVNNLISGLRLPFYGEPLNGLQILGMLETRLLDFTDIIMISVNEGLLPKGKHQTTFIPDEVRTHFGMQRYHERTAVFAYHFYRLMQRTENAWLIYNTEGDELGGGEKSRFISQMLYELPKVNPKIRFKEQTLSVVPGDVGNDAITIKKSPDVVARLQAIADRGLSPTAIAMYTKCKLQFYFSQVLRISEPDEVTETIDAATLGEIVHAALHKSYQAVKNAPVTSGVISNMIPEAIRLVNEVFSEKFNSGELSTGKNFLIVKVAENMIQRFLITEKLFLEKTKSVIEVLMLEESLDTIIEVKNPQTSEVFKVKIHGNADRIDKVGGITRIIDYKTGKVDNKELKLDLITDLLEKENSGKLLQVLMYALMFSDKHANEKLQLISGIISMRKSSAYLIKTDIAKSALVSKELLNAFKTELKIILWSIFDSSEAFVQTEYRETCAICNFNTICNRVVN